ncbi:hypothetical protein GUJ93_ZPchr0010g8987 [Zizania palustris]|uniref:NAC domain-containing protein n=1 Tax=Zizania palustris TaxID=103762 RepID=A0A8J5W9X5_ZIZPA|nr:hypothetical protein GUJ93_ZPchr0010g8987 [Zizania palustris]
MSFIGMVEARMPPGFRFHPRDDELVLDYLLHKLAAAGGGGGGGGGGVYGGGVAIVDVDLNKCEPWDLPEAACVGGKEWYFFSLRDRKYATGQRTNRATRSGYWKATGKDRAIARRGGDPVAGVVGMRKTLVFYRGRAPKGSKTEWVMHEFRLEPHNPHLKVPHPSIHPPLVSHSNRVAPTRSDHEFFVLSSFRFLLFFSFPPFPPTSTTAREGREEEDD